MSAGSSAAWSGSFESFGSFGSFGSGLHGKRDRRRRKKASQPAATKSVDDGKKRIFQCTFCTDTFRSKYDWTRHEKSLHLSLEKWNCAPLGPVIMDQSTGINTCVYCLATNPSTSHIENHGHRQCEEKGHEARTFYRKDHLRQHLRLMHGSELLPHMDAWKSVAANINSRCGFCDQRFTVWQDRVDHIAAHFKDGVKMASWRGCRGLDPAVAAHVLNAMPPYLIGVESKSTNPFTATNPSNPPLLDAIYDIGLNVENVATVADSLLPQAHPPVPSKATCWEILTIHLGTYVRSQAELGHNLSDEMLQREGRRILYGDPDDTWNQTAADNPEWLELFKKAHGLELIPTSIGGQGTYVPEDLEMYGDLGLRVPYSIQVTQSQPLLTERHSSTGTTSTTTRDDKGSSSSHSLPSAVTSGFQSCNPRGYTGHSSLVMPSDKVGHFETVRIPTFRPGVLGQEVKSGEWHTAFDYEGLANSTSGEQTHITATTTASAYINPTTMATTTASADMNVDMNVVSDTTRGIDGLTLQHHHPGLQAFTRNCYDNACNCYDKGDVDCPNRTTTMTMMPQQGMKAAATADSVAIDDFYFDNISFEI